MEKTKFAFDFLTYARVKCGEGYPETLLGYVNRNLEDIKTLTFKQAKYFLDLKTVLEK